MLEWLSDIVTALLEIVPRRVIIRATHAGVKWGLRGRPVELKPGWRWYWPLISSVEIIPVARQTLDLPTQALLSKDGKQVIASGVVVYSIQDIVKAIGERNFDVDATVSDISQAVIVEVMTTWKFCDLFENIGGRVKEDLTGACRKQLRCFGVYVHRVALTDFSSCRSLNLLGVNLSIVGE